MKYDIDDIQKSQEIFSFLLERHELSESTGKELFRAYLSSGNIQTLLESQAMCSRATITRYDDVIYLVPNQDNSFLGFTKTELKNKLCWSGATEVEYRLSLFAILVLIVQFYDGCGTDVRSRDLLRFGDWQNSISDYLKVACARAEFTEQPSPYQEMRERYESLETHESCKIGRGQRSRRTKDSFLREILIFLKDQNLLDYTSDTIIPRRKFDHFMEWNLLSFDTLDRVSDIFSKSAPQSEDNEVRDEQD